MVLRRGEGERCGRTRHPVMIVSVVDSRWGFCSVVVVVRAWGALNRIRIDGGCSAAPDTPRVHEHCVRELSSCL